MFIWGEIRIHQDEWRKSEHGKIERRGDKKGRLSASRLLSVPLPG